MVFMCAIAILQTKLYLEGGVVFGDDVLLIDDGDRSAFRVQVGEVQISCLAVHVEGQTNLNISFRGRDDPF